MKLRNKKRHINCNKRKDEPLSDGILNYGLLSDGLLSDGILINRCHEIIHSISLVEAAG